ncbi:hypothetical protein LCI18_007692 [Fusarium solani-melongenae]|uniref:Uncharacterized protein n=1 Tax=Fusarium solani subsp. cucurbitae TaxID=2747967 RepID=A0ACD3Z6N4_FUSSC|nr:hypothetical protein LCI18_007692 [Fusarium solani-melongenae]
MNPKAETYRTYHAGALQVYPEPELIDDDHHRNRGHKCCTPHQQRRETCFACHTDRSHPSWLLQTRLTSVQLAKDMGMQPSHALHVSVLDSSARHVESRDWRGEHAVLYSAGYQPSSEVWLRRDAEVYITMRFV